MLFYFPDVIFMLAHILSLSKSLYDSQPQTFTILSSIFNILASWDNLQYQAIFPYQLPSKLFCSSYQYKFFTVKGGQYKH